MAGIWTLLQGDGTYLVLGTSGTYSLLLFLQMSKVRDSPTVCTWSDSGQLEPAAQEGSPAFTADVQVFHAAQQAFSQTGCRSSRPLPLTRTCLGGPESSVTPAHVRLGIPEWMWWTLSGFHGT